MIFPCFPTFSHEHLPFTVDFPIFDTPFWPGSDHDAIACTVALGNPLANGSAPAPVAPVAPVGAIGDDPITVRANITGISTAMQACCHGWGGVDDILWPRLGRRDGIDKQKKPEVWLRCDVPISVGVLAEVLSGSHSCRSCQQNQCVSSVDVWTSINLDIILNVLRYIMTYRKCLVTYLVQCISPY